MTNQPRNRFKYVCEDCSDETFFNSKEFLRASRPHCPGCGSTRLVPKTEMARDRLLTGETAKAEQAVEFRKRGMAL